MVERGASSRLDFLRIPFRHLAYWLIESRQRYLISTALLALAGLLASSFQRGQPSTYICSIVSGQTWRIPLFRFVSVILDAAILVWLAKIETMWIGSAEQQRKTMSRQWGSLLLVSFLCGSLMWMPNTGRESRHFGYSLHVSYPFLVHMGVSPSGSEATTCKASLAKVAWWPYLPSQPCNW